MFHFKGQIAPSKSLINRLLIIQSFDGRLNIIGDSQADDVVALKKNLENFKLGQSDKSKKNVFELGLGATTLRFFALRISRSKGTYQILIPKELSQRPNTELFDIMSALGAKCELNENHIRIESEGWTEPPQKKLVVDVSKSSQFLSALVLNAWGLDFDLNIEVKNPNAWVSQSYFEMTLKMCSQLGMEIQKLSEFQYKIPKQQKLNHFVYATEPDMSSSAAVCALALFGGCVVVDGFVQESLQPDFIFIELFKKIGFQVHLSRGQLVVAREVHHSIKAIEENLNLCPDLFPVLAVMASFAEGVSKFYGAHHLQYKETNRISQVSKLLKLLGVQHDVLEDGMQIYGNPHLKCSTPLKFDVSHDHRMAMAGAMALLKFPNLELVGKDSVTKSFPNFWDIFNHGVRR